MERLSLKSKVLSENQRIAESLRARFRENGVLCLNLISSPGSGKTALLEQTLAPSRPQRPAWRCSQAISRRTTMRSAWRASAFLRSKSPLAEPVIWTEQ